MLGVVPKTPAPRRPKKRGENAKVPPRGKRGRPFPAGNQAAKGHGRPKKDWDIETEAKALTPAILARFAAMGANARTPHDVAAGRVVIAYAEGLPRARHEHSGPGGGPIPVQRDERKTTEEMRRELEELVGTPGGVPAPTEGTAGGEGDGDDPGAAGDDEP